VQIIVWYYKIKVMICSKCHWIGIFLNTPVSSWQCLYAVSPSWSTSRCTLLASVLKCNSVLHGTYGVTCATVLPSLKQFVYQWWDHSDTKILVILFQLICMFFCVVYEVTHLTFYILFCLISKLLIGLLCGHPPPILKSLCYTDYQI